MIKTNQLEIFRRATSKVFRRCLFSTSIPLPFIKTQLSQLKITLKYQALSCFGRAVRFFQESFDLSALGLKSLSAS